MAKTLEDIPGVGPAIAEKLQEAGYTDLMAIAVAAPADLAEKCEIEQEIETVITEAKSEAYVMLVMPFVILAIISVGGRGLMDTLFTTTNGRIAATVSIALIAIAGVITVHSGNIEV